LRQDLKKRRSKMERTNLEDKSLTVTGAAITVTTPVNKPVAPTPAPRVSGPTKTLNPRETSRSTAQPLPISPVTEPMLPQPIAQTAEPGPSRLLPLHTPAPDYPSEALRSNTTGQVVASFTVNTDGSVSNIKIISANPRGVFERSVRSTLRDWRFQPISESRSITRTFKFSP
jgi:protein TonB